MMVIWPRIAGLLVVGYLGMTRSFAYLGFPPLNIFIGEIVLAAFLLLKPRVAFGTWTASLLRPSRLNALGIGLLLFMMYGVWQVGRGVLDGNSVVHTLKFFIFNYYSLYLFLGIWVALHNPDFLPRLIRAIAWVNGVYGLLYIVAFKHVIAHVPGSDVPLFGQPGGGWVAILGLLLFERDLRAVWPVLVLNIVVTLAVQVRAEWLGLAAGTLVWGLLTGRLSRVIVMGLTGLAVLGALELADIRLDGRTGQVSLGETLSRIIAPIDVDLARQFDPDAENAASTVDWRQKWWKQIWLSAHSTPMLEAFGHGYGFDLLSLAPSKVREGQAREIRTPHSVFYYALGHTGWIGVALFGLLQFTILRLLWQAFRVGGQPAGIVLWAAAISMACFEESFETPYRAIPFYLLMGMALAPGLQSNGEVNARLARVQLLSVARR